MPAHVRHTSAHVRHTSAHVQPRRPLFSPVSPSLKAPTQPCTPRSVPPCPAPLRLAPPFPASLPLPSGPVLYRHVRPCSVLLHSAPPRLGLVPSHRVQSCHCCVPSPFFPHQSVTSPPASPRLALPPSQRVPLGPVRCRPTTPRPASPPPALPRFAPPAPHPPPFAPNPARARVRDCVRAYVRACVRACLRASSRELDRQFSLRLTEKRLHHLEDIFRQPDGVGCAPPRAPLHSMLLSRPRKHPPAKGKNVAPLVAPRIGTINIESGVRGGI